MHGQTATENFNVEFEFHDLNSIMLLILKAFSANFPG